MDQSVKSMRGSIVGIISPRLSYASPTFGPEKGFFSHRISQPTI